ncbi:MAG TPA: TIGR02466 family protein [Stellaceae bacterium]|jgi:uncharacterized protein (TIGR02466 family)|nr:TIGR02466 family protein [Stellaceae bacterium]
MRELASARFARLFASPLLEHLWADAAELNPLLRDSILEYARQHPGRDRTNVGGWHSQPGTLEFCGDAGQRLVRHMRDMIEEATQRLFIEHSSPPPSLSWIFSAWANINRRGDFNQMHTHPGATWSGVYYVDHGESNPDAEGTAIHLCDPNPARTNIFFPELSTTNVMFKPQPGLMILFPSYVPHTVLPHRGDRARISIAFNVRKEPFP